MPFKTKAQSRNQGISQAFNEYVEFAKKNSPFYAELYEGILSSEDSPKIPVIEHSRYWDNNGYMNSRVMTGPQVDGIVLRTGGTTSKPKFTAYSQIELQKTASLLADGLVSAGTMPGDRIGNLFYAGECYGSYLLHILSVAALPLPAVQVPIGGQITAESMEQLIDQCNVNVLLSTPTTLTKLAKRGLEQKKTFPYVRVVMFSGEPLFQDQRPMMQSVFPNATFRSCIYGSIDAGVVGTSVDVCDPRVHRIVPGIVAEIQTDNVDEPFTQENGVEGRLIVTNLLRRLTPVIRYPTGDRAQWIDREAGIFRLLGRDNHSLRLGPVSLDVRDLRRIIINALAEVPVVAFQALLWRRDGRDLLQCCIDADLQDEESARFRVKAYLLSERPMLAEHIATGHIVEPEIKFMSITEMKVNPATGKLLYLFDGRSVA